VPFADTGTVEASTWTRTLCSNIRVASKVIEHYVERFAIKPGVIELHLVGKIGGSGFSTLATAR
jgi:hypothetical protein